MTPSLARVAEHATLPRPVSIMVSKSERPSAVSRYCGARRVPRFGVPGEVDPPSFASASVPPSSGPVPESGTPVVGPAAGSSDVQAATAPTKTKTKTATNPTPPAALMWGSVLPAEKNFSKDPPLTVFYARITRHSSATQGRTLSPERMTSRNLGTSRA
jgi:hypothetical protein